MRSLLISAAAALALAACATGPTGPDAAGRFDSFQAIETSDFRGYDRVQLLMPVPSAEVAARIDARTVGRSDIRPISRRDMDAKLMDLRDDLARELGKQVRIVEQAGPGVVTVRTTLTALNANRPTMAEMADSPGLSFDSIAAGDAAVRIELLEDGQLLAVIDDRDNVTSLNDPGVNTAAIWGTADQFFRQVASKLGALFAG